MQLLIVADTYPPARISGAVQLHDLAGEMVAQGYQATVLVPACDLRTPFVIEQVDGVTVLRVRAPKSKDVGLVRRALAEMRLPFALLRGLRSSVLAATHWDGVVWYSPTIFLGLVASRIKRTSGCAGYLILRDLFPDWAVDAGVMKRGLAYRFFKAVERFQYRVADVIGVQTPSNVALVARDAPAGTRIEVLHNWLRNTGDDVGSAACFDLGSLAGRTIFVYAGNMGVAQDMDAFLDLAGRLVDRQDIGFLFVGRGSEAARLHALTVERSLSNVKFMEEIDSVRIPALLKLCHVGIVALDPRHTTHNIPGKFVAYVSNGLPVLARVSPGNDLAGVIRATGVGCVVEGDSPSLLQSAAERLAADLQARMAMSQAGRELAERSFTPAAAVRQIVASLGRAARSSAKVDSIG
jgi:glycosyltransferase involved in cell wall biosynthesis